MSDATAGGYVTTWPSDKSLDRAFVAAYAVALTGNVAVTWLTFVYVGPGVGGVREANPITAAVIDALGRTGMVATRTAVLVGGYWCYAYLRGVMRWSVVVVAFAWVGAGVQLLNLAADLQVAVLAGLPSQSAILAGVAVVVPALVAGVVLRPPASPLVGE